MALLMGRWARAQLAEQYSLRSSREGARLVAIAYRVERKCVQLMPGSVEDLYGLGSLHCALGTEPDAESTLRQADEQDVVLGKADPIMAIVYADSELDNASAARDREHSLGRFAAYATRAIYVGDEYRWKALRDSLGKSLIWLIHKQGEEKFIALSIIERFLHERGYAPAS